MFISFGHLTTKSLLILAVPILIFFRRFLSDSIKLEKANNMFYTGFIRFLGRSLNGILWIILKKTTASDKKENQDNKVTIDQNIPTHIDILDNNESKKYSVYLQYELNYNIKMKKNNFKEIFLLMLVCFLDFFTITYKTIIKKISFNKKHPVSLLTLTVVIRLFSIAFLSHLMIKNLKMYSHHYLSVIIILIVVIAIHIISIFTKDYVYYLKKLGIMIIPELLYSVIYVCGAKYLSITKENIYKLLFIDGINGMILSILLQIISYFFIPCIKIQDNDFFADDTFSCDENAKFKTMMKIFPFENFGYLNLIYSVLLILVTFCEMWLLWLLIISFSVNHYAAVHPIPLFFYFIIKHNKNKDFQIINYTMFILAGIVIIFMSFVFNEIIVLKFCGFNKNTATEITRRSLRESNCDFEEDEDEIFTKSNENYLIMKEDIEGIIDDKEKSSELSVY